MFDKQEDAESFYNSTIEENSDILFRDKKSHSSLGDAINENPLSDYDQRLKGHPSTANNTIDYAKLENNSKTTKISILKTINSGLSKFNDKNETQSKIIGIANIVGLRYKGGSYYNEFSTPKGSMTIRLSHHKANGDNFSKNSSDNNISVVIERYVKDANPSVNSYSEYVYSEKTLEESPKHVIESVLTGVYNAIETGEFNDNSGLANVTHYNNKKPSIYGGAFDENLDDGNVTKSGGTPNSMVNRTKNTTNLIKETQYTKNNIQKRLNIGISEYKKEQNEINRLAGILKLHHKGGSYYSEFITPKGTMTLRLSHHKANGDNFKRNNSEKNISIVIEKYNRDSKSSDVTYSEYVYPVSSIGKNSNNVIENILKSVNTALETGEYIDNSGLAEVTHYNEKTLFKGNNKESKLNEINSFTNEDQINLKFNSEIDNHKNGTIKANTIFNLGNPKGVLKYFLPDLPIIMRSKTVTKGVLKKHNVSYEALKNFPLKLSSPIFIFKRNDNTLGILTEIKDNSGKNVCVAIEIKSKIQQGSEILEVNSIQSFHGRETQNIIDPIINNNSLQWVDKQKGLEWISSVQLNGQELSKQDRETNKLQNLTSIQSTLEIENKYNSFDSAVKVIKNFENPSQNINYLTTKKYSSPFEQRKEELEPRKTDKQSITNSLNQLSDEFNTPINIVNSVSELPLHLRDKAKKAHNPHGLYDPKTDSVWFITDNIPTDSEAQKTFLHEVVAHKKLRGLLKNDFNGFLDTVYNSLSKEQQDAIKKEYPGKSNRVCTEEYIATIAEGNISVPLWKKIVASIRDFFRRYT